MSRLLRESVERASVPPARALAALPMWVPVLGLLGCMLAGVLIGGVGGAILLTLPLAVLGWLLYLGWPRLRAPERAMRLAVLALVVVIALVQVVPR